MSITENSTLKVAFISPFAEIGGAEKVVLDLAKGLLKKGISVFLLTQAEGSFSRAFRAIGGQTAILKMPAWRKGKNFLARYFAAIKIRRWLRRLDFPLVHCNSFRLTPYLTFLEKITPIRYLTHIHELVEGEKIAKFKIKKHHHIVAVSRSAAKEFLDRGIMPQIIPNAIHPEKFQFSIEKFAEKDPTIGIIAHYFPSKRLFLFLDIAAAILKIMPGTRFEIIGANVGRTEITEEGLKKYAEQKGVLEVVRFSGGQADVSEALAKWHAFLFPVEKESFGLVVLEAIASGCIVFADKNSGGPAEIVENGVNGFLLDCTDVDRSASQVAAILGNRELCASVAAYARKTLEERYGMEAFLDRFLSYYRDIADSQQRTLL